MRMVARATFTMVPDRVLSSALRCHRWMATVTGNTAAKVTTSAAPPRSKPPESPSEPGGWPLPIRRETDQISNVPSEIHRDPVWCPVRIERSGDHLAAA